jgi:ribosomal protein L11 methyltransferase
LFCENEAQAQAVAKQFGGSIRKLAKADWQKSPAAPRPIKVRDAILLTAETGVPQIKALRKAHPRRKIISIPPEMAFGTGDHATTSTCLRMLVDIARERKNSTWTVADLGAGTGVLAIAAKHLGAGETFACDFDPFAVSVAQRNAERNNTPDIVIKEQDVLQWKPRAKGYDVVLANIFSTVLIQAWPVIAKSLARNGELVVSGILATQAWDVFKAAAANGLGFTSVVTKGKWVTARGGHMADLITKGNAR